MLKWIFDLSHGELREEILGLGMKAFAADQVFQWLYGKNVQDISAWTNIGKANRERLAETYDTALNRVIDIAADRQGTRKFLIELKDEKRIEAVLMAEKRHHTFCISSQAGCALGCTFCATGMMGLKRDLSPGEIVSQVLTLKKELAEYTGKINLVFMGMGEPLLNYENLKRALEIITAEKGMSISPRNITVSTAGILAGIRRLEQDFPRVKISLSLNAADAGLREELMPISRKEKPGALLGYFRETRRKQRLTFEYVLIKGVNDSINDAKKLANMVKGIPCKINLIPYNEIAGCAYQSPKEEQVEAFSRYLHENGFTVVVRRSKGREIASACGQLTGESR